MALDAGDLPLGGGLLAILRPALNHLSPGGAVAISVGAAATGDLEAWCRLERHEHLGHTLLPDGRHRHLIRRGREGAAAVWSGGVEAGDRGASGPGALEAGRAPRTADLMALCPPPARADPQSGFAPRGSLVEPGGPPYPFTLLERDRVAPPEVGALYDAAVAAQWDASRDIPWDRMERLPPALGRALGQTMSFLAENELAALYLPARFIPRLHPAYAEMAMLLAVQLADEARHIDVFLKRAWATGAGLGVSSATTALSLRTLLAHEDFTEASFMLSVLGEGTFLDLLKFIEEHAPDEATLEIARRTRADEARHVRTGLLHIRHALASDPGLAARLEAAVHQRAATMHAETIPPTVQDALTILAARGTDPRAIARAHEAFRALLATMFANRQRRLAAAGFPEETAARLSELHTPNFM